MKQISYKEFTQVELRAGTIIRSETFQEARKSALKVWVDFGPEIGIKQSSAQITEHYTPESIIGKSVVGCINLGTKKIAGFTSEFLLVGFPDENKAVCLVSCDYKVPNGAKVF